MTLDTGVTIPLDQDKQRPAYSLNYLTPVQYRESNLPNSVSTK